MTTTTLPSHASDQTLLDHDARLELLMKIALRERLLVLMNEPSTPLEQILKLLKSLEKMQDRSFKQQKANLAAVRQEQRARQLTVDEARIELRQRSLELRELEHHRKQQAAAAREIARSEKAARQAERSANRNCKKSVNDFPPSTEPAKVATPSALDSTIPDQANENMVQKAA